MLLMVVMPLSQPTVGPSSHSIFVVAHVRSGWPLHYNHLNSAPYKLHQTFLPWGSQHMLRNKTGHGKGFPTGKTLDGEELLNCWIVIRVRIRALKSATRPWLAITIRLIPSLLQTADGWLSAVAASSEAWQPVPEVFHLPAVQKHDPLCMISSS